MFCNKICDELNELVEDRDFAAEQLLETKQNLDETKHFVGLDIEIEKLLELKYVNARFGRLPKDSYVKLATALPTLRLALETSFWPRLMLTKAQQPSPIITAMASATTVSGNTTVLAALP